MEYTAPEKRLLKIIEELRGTPDIEVASDVADFDIDDEEAQTLPEIAAALREARRDRPEWAGLVLDPEIETCGFRFFAVGSHWRSTSVDGLGGEFRMPCFYDAVANNPPPLAWEGASDQERELFSQFHEVDGHPHAGNGFVVCVRLQPSTTPLEVWAYDPRRGPRRMELDYCTYLDALLVTKGTYGWQYLFTDVSFSDSDYQHLGRGLRQMFDIFPQLFPNYDYEPLRARFEERL